MPRKPVAASGNRTPLARDRADDGSPLPAKSFSAAAAHTRFSAAHTSAVRARPNSGTSQNAAARTPATAPKVLPAYSAALGEPWRRICAKTLSIAGSVAPIAAVAGNSSTKVPEKATAHCQAGEACAPVRSSSHLLAGAKRNASARLHNPIAASHAAYQCAGFGLR